MGEAKRRRDRLRETAPQRQAELAAARERGLELERLMSEDPGDRADREAHGFSYDDWRDQGLLCRNGCGLPYSEVVAGKIRKCLAATTPAPA